jgi:hypothetical protein
MTFRSFTFRLDCSLRRHAFAPRQRSQVISPGRIIDGDTLEIHGTRIRTLKMSAVSIAAAMPRVELASSTVYWGLLRRPYKSR